MKSLINILSFALLVGTLAGSLGLFQPWEYPTKVGDKDEFGQRVIRAKAVPTRVAPNSNAEVGESIGSLIDRSPTKAEYETSLAFIETFNDDRARPLPPLKKGDHAYAF